MVEVVADRVGRAIVLGLVSSKRRLQVQVTPTEI